jgi:hypothetical protein
MDKLGAKTHELSGLIHGNISLIKSLEDQKRGASGEIKDAVDLLIKDKVWKIQRAIGTFWRETLDITTETTGLAPCVIPPHISGISGGM